MARGIIPTTPEERYIQQAEEYDLMKMGVVADYGLPEMLKSEPDFYSAMWKTLGIETMRGYASSDMHRYAVQGQIARYDSGNDIRALLTAGLGMGAIDSVVDSSMYHAVNADPSPILKVQNEENLERKTMLYEPSSAHQMMDTQIKYFS